LPRSYFVRFAGVVTDRFIVRWSPHEAHGPLPFSFDIVRRISQTAAASTIAAAITC
jgi:hypothetical protein